MGEHKKVHFSTTLGTSLDDDGDFNTSRVSSKGPALETVKYRNPNERQPAVLAPPSSLSRPNYEDILRRVSVVIHRHIERCEARLSKLTPDNMESGMFHMSKMKKFSEENFTSPQYVYHFVRSPILLSGFCYGIRPQTVEWTTPTLQEVHDFLTNIFVRAQLSAECSIVCLIYVERLMENANVPLVACTWRPCLLCGLLLASKVWQDLSSWNSEISAIYPQYSLRSVNHLERLFCEDIKWDLYISSSDYAKYYFALRSLTEKQHFRRNYNVMVNAPGAQQIAVRTEEMKEHVLATLLSRSL